MSKTKILDELPKLTTMELDKDDWLDDEDPLTVQEKSLLNARLSGYAKSPDAGSTWEEVEGRIQARISRHIGSRLY